MKIQITIPYNLISLNKLNKMHWAAKSKENKKVGNLVAVQDWNITWDEMTKQEDSFFVKQLKNEYLATGRSSIKLRPKSKVKLTIKNTRGKGSRLLDKVNLYGAIKGLEDQLVKMGLIVDDRDQWCTTEVTQEKSNSLSAVEIIIEYI